MDNFLGKYRLPEITLLFLKKAQADQFAAKEIEAFIK